jgi:hypothetical protein
VEAGGGLMRELALGGLIAITFGMGSYYATDHFGVFNYANVILGGLAIAFAAARGLSRLRGASAPAFRGVLIRGVLGILAAALLGTALERAANYSGIQFDWSFERKFALSEATVTALDDLPCELTASLYYDDFDPRTRSTRLLLRTMERSGGLRFDEKRIDDHPDDEDRYAIGSSNTVVFRCGGEAETVERPTEGAIYEALYRFRSFDRRTLYLSRGAGEGNLARGDAIGFSGLAQALRTEGYRLDDLVTASVSEIPKDADAVILIAPARPLRREAIDALDRYLGSGGRVVAFVEPGRESGIEKLLADWGIRSPNSVLIDPASGPVDGDAPGVNPIAFNYTTSHPAARGLDSSRMTFFRGARSFELRKPRPADKLVGVVFASHRSWLHADLGVLSGKVEPERPPGAAEDYHPLVVAAAYPREDAQARIVAFGDSDFASNRHLRTLYNLDLVLNSIHWALEREPDITMRPKTSLGTMQFPLPVANTLRMFQGLGLLLPELLLIAAAVIWLRRRSA